jgi:PAB1-binding protein PBP1
MGFEVDGDPPTGNPGVVDDSVEVAMDLEETTASVVRKSMEKSGSRTSTSKLAHTSTSTSRSTTTSTKARLTTGMSTGTKTFFIMNSTYIYISSGKFVLNKSISMELRFNTFPVSS